MAGKATCPDTGPPGACWAWGLGGAAQPFPSPPKLQHMVCRESHPAQRPAGPGCPPPRLAWAGRSGSESCGHGQLPCGLRLLGVRRVCAVDFHEMVPERAARPWAWAQASLSAVRREGACRPAGQESARHLAGRASGSGGVVRVWAPVLSPRSRARRVRLVRRSGRGVALFGRPRRRPARQGQHREPPAGPPPQAQPPSHGVAPRAE